MKRLLFPIALGLSGVAVLVSLGLWQLDRLDWKEAILADLEARIAAAPVAMPQDPQEDTDEYAAVQITGTLDGQDELHVLTSGTAAGTGYRVIRPFTQDNGDRLLLDIGLLPLDAKTDLPTPSDTSLTVTGNLIWPDDVNSSTPEPDLAKNIWFGRDLARMSAALNTQPIMVVAADISAPDPRTTLLPVDTSTIKNDHLSYAVTWFGLALVWAAMTLFLISRILRSKEN